MHKGIKISAAAAGLTMLIGASGVPTAEAADRLSERASAQLPASISELRLSEPLTVAADSSVIDAATQHAQGRQQVLVRLRTPSVAKSKSKSPAAQQQHKARLQNEQSAFFKRASKQVKGKNNGHGKEDKNDIILISQDRLGVLGCWYPAK